MTFFGRYLEVVPDQRIVWTNEEGDSGQVTTVTFASDGDGTLLTVTDTFPSKQALDNEIASGAMGAMPQQLDQLDQPGITDQPKISVTTAYAFSR